MSPVTPEVEEVAVASVASVDAGVAGPLARRYVIAPGGSRFEVHVRDLFGGEYATTFDRWRGYVLTEHGVAVTADVDMRSLRVDTPSLEGFARHALEVDAHPKASLAGAIRVRDRATGDALVDGILDLHGVRRHVSFAGKLSREGRAYRFRSQTALARSDFGIRVPLVYEPFVRDRVGVVIDVVAEPERVTVEEIDGGS